MKHKTWLRLVLKCVGVLLIGLGLPEAIRQAGVFMQLYRMHAAAANTGAMPAFFGPNGQGLGFVINFLAGFIQLAMGVYLFVGGRWVVDRLVPTNRPYCPDCGYPLKGLTRDTCPECGGLLPRDGSRTGPNPPPQA